MSEIPEECFGLGGMRDGAWFKRVMEPLSGGFSNWVCDLEAYQDEGGIRLDIYNGDYAQAHEVLLTKPQAAALARKLLEWCVEDVDE